MKKLKFAALIAAVSAIGAFAQPSCEWCGPPDTWDPTFTLSGAMGVGANYHSFIPVSQKPVELKIDNLSSEENHVMMIGVDADGARTMGVIAIPANGSYTMPAAAVEGYRRLHLLSLNSFRAVSSRPLKLLGAATTHFASISPQRQIQRVKVRKPDGSGVMVVAVDANGQAYYPAVGNRFGSYDPTTQTVTRLDGAVFSVEN